MHKYFFSIVCILIVLINFSSCKQSTLKSDELDINQIYQKFNVYIRENKYKDHKTFVRAEFLVPNTKANKLNKHKKWAPVQLVPPSLIKVNGHEMKEVDDLVHGHFYSYNFDGSDNSEFFFDWKINDSLNYKNLFRLEAIFIRELPDNIILDKDFEITWDGTPVNANEKVTVTISVVLNGKEQKIEKQSTQIGDKKIIFPLSTIKELINKVVNVSVTRAATHKIIQTNKAGGEISFTYESAPHQIKFVKN